MLVWFKYQAKTSSRSRVCVLGEWQKFIPPSPPLTKDETLRDIEHSTRIGNLVWGVNIVTVSFLIRYDSLLQNTANIITKRDSYFITNCKMRKFYYKMRQLLQIVTIFLQNAIVVTKCDIYYELQQYTVPMTTIGFVLWSSCIQERFMILKILQRYRTQHHIFSLNS